MFLSHLSEKCEAKEAPLFDVAFTEDSQRILVKLLLRFDRLRCLVQGATEQAQQKQLRDDIKADAKELGLLLVNAEDSQKLSRGLQDVLV